MRSFVPQKMLLAPDMVRNALPGPSGAAKTVRAAPSSMRTTRMLQGNASRTAKNGRRPSSLGMRTKATSRPSGDQAGLPSTSREGSR